MNGFTEEEVKFLDSFGEFLISKARMDLTIPEIIQMNRYLSQYNALRKKVAAHLLEIKKIHTPESQAEEAPAAETPKPSRSKK